MNVTCDKCGKRYVISDDKVAGKSSVKIRCKQCQNLISVTVTVAAVAPAPIATGGGVVPSQRSPWEEESTRAMPPLDTTAQWFAMLGGKQQGPFDLNELQRRVMGGEVTLRTYLWKAGMGDWKRAADVPEVSPVFAGVSVPAPPVSSSLSQPPGPVPTAAARPASKAAPAVQRDVATANEVPAQAASKPTAQNGAGAVVHKHEPLNDLFGDVNLDSTGATNNALAGVPGPAADVSSSISSISPEPQPADQPVDPFAALTQDDGKNAPPPGEATRFFIAQAGVNKRNPPWKIALFVLAFVVAPIVLVYVLNTFEIVKLPTVTRTDENGQEVQESFFSAGGAAGLKDLLTGDAKKKKAEADRLKAEQDAARAKALALKNPNNNTVKNTEPEVVVPRPQDPNLAAFYGEDDRKTAVPKIRKMGDDGSSTTAVNTSGLSPESVGKVVADKSKAFQTCIDNALRRNPNLAVGNVTVVLNVGPSGAVKSAGVEPKKHEGTDWGQCMMSTGKRIVFPGSDGETQVELPFKVGVAVSP
ncbi:MAG: GYF domain-containing protein [Archangium sp.]